jgi:signal transduction histidine kinase
MTYSDFRDRLEGLERRLAELRAQALRQRAERLASALADLQIDVGELRAAAPPLLIDESGKPGGCAGTERNRAWERALQAEWLAAIGQMVAGLAHESGNALQRTQAALARLARRVKDRPEALALVADIQRAQDHLHRLHEEVRAYAAPVKLEPRPCDLAGVWREAWAQLAVEREGRDAALCEEVGTAGAWVVDPFRLTQVFRNILENSLAACPDPVRIVVRTSAAEVEGRPAVRVVVRDNGPGLSPEQRQRIFEPFYTTRTRGTGLGMVISKRIVEAHGGHIAAGGDGRPGAEIVITLPWRKP